MIKPIGLEELVAVAPIPGPIAARTVAALTDPVKRQLVWFLQWQSHQDGGLKRFTYDLLAACGWQRLGSPTMCRVGFDAHTHFSGADFEAICGELDYWPAQSLEHLRERLESGGDVTFDDLMPDDGSKDSQRRRQERAIAWEKERREIEQMMRPERRRASAATFLYTCRHKAARELPQYLARLCSDPGATWSVIYFHDLVGALETALQRQSELTNTIVAPTRIATIVGNAVDFAHRTKSLVLIKGVERVGKTEGAKRYAFANPDKARMISLTAATTDSLFYEEIFSALGCGDKDSGSNSEMRSAIRDTLRNQDITLVFDEAHCLFGLSEKASIKRLEYIRTELVNRGVPVVLIITPQFAKRLSDLESKTSFNVNQFRGRITRWAELPDKPSRSDIECLSRFYLPDVPQSVHRLLSDFAQQSEYPFAAMKQAITEARELLAATPGAALDDDFVSKAIGFALFTNKQVAATLPGTDRPATTSKRRTNAASTPIEQLPLPDVPEAALQRAQQTRVRTDGEHETADPRRRSQNAVAC